MVGILIVRAKWLISPQTAGRLSNPEISWLWEYLVSTSDSAFLEVEALVKNGFVYQGKVAVLPPEVDLVIGLGCHNTNNVFNRPCQASPGHSSRNGIETGDPFTYRFYPTPRDWRKSPDYPQELRG